MRPLHVRAEYREYYRASKRLDCYNSRMDRDLQLLFELGTLRHVPRTWNQFGDPGFANVSEHVFRMAWIAMVLAKREGADVAKVLRMAMVHDVTESRTGDVHMLTRRYVERDDKKAADHMFAETSLADDAQSLLKEYAERATLEAKIVKDADLLDVDMEIRELQAKGGKYPARWDEKRTQVAATELHTESARAMWKELYAADPFAWYADGIDRNDNPQP